MSLFRGQRFHSTEDFLYLLENMKFKITDSDGEAICQFFALLPRELWEDQLDRLHEEKKRPEKKEAEKKATREEQIRLSVSPCAQRLLRFFDTSTVPTIKECAAQRLTKAYWGTLLQSEESDRRSSLSSLIRHLPRELGIDIEEDDGLFHKAIDAIPDVIRHTELGPIAYRALVKAKRAPFTFAEIQCPTQTVGGVPVCVNAPYMPKFGERMARDLSSSLNITHGQFMGHFEALKGEAAQIKTLKACLQNEGLCRLLEGERGKRSTEQKLFEVTNFKIRGTRSDWTIDFHTCLMWDSFRDFLRKYAKGELGAYERLVIEDNRDRDFPCSYHIGAKDLDNAVISLNLFPSNIVDIQTPEFQDLFVHNGTNIVGAQFRCILRHILDQDDIPPAAGGLSDRSQELLGLVKDLEEDVPFTYIQRRYLALKPGQKLMAKKGNSVDVILETLCEVMLDLLDEKGPFVKPMPNNYGSTIHSTMPYYYNELLGPHLGLVSSCPNRTYNERHCQIAIYHRWDSKLSVPQALQKFYELLTPEYVVAKIRERMIRYGQGTAEELTDEMLVKKLIEARIFETVSAEVLPG